MKKIVVLLIVFVLLAGSIGSAAAGIEIVTICHKPGTEDEETLFVPLPALNAHLGHGDFIGECGSPTTPSITGHKWEDLNANGIFDGVDPGLGGWTIYVDYNNNSVLDDGEPLSLTAADGSYAIVDINPGTWTVREMPQNGWHCSFPNQGSETAPVISAECFYTQDFNPGEVVAGKDFGNWRYAVKGGYVWEDFYPDGHWETATEPPIPGLTIDFWDITSGTPIIVDTQITDGSGYYEFGMINPGRSFAVCEDQYFGYTQTFPMPSSPLPTSELLYDCSALGIQYAPNGYQFTAQSSGIFVDNDFGNTESFP